MNWNPMSWFSRKDDQMSLDRLVQRFAMIQNTMAGIKVDPSTALGAPTVFSIVTRLARTVASLPFAVHKDLSEPGAFKTETLRDHAVTTLLARRPNKFQTPYEYWSLAVLRMLLWGVFYAEKRVANGRVTALIPHPPENVQREQATSGRIVYKVTDENGVTRPVPSDKMHVITSLNFDILEPITPVQRCPEAIAMEIAAEQYGATVFGSGAIPNGIITRDGHFEDEESLDRFRNAWTKAFRKKRGTAILEDSFKFEAVQMNNEESQFLETRKHQRSVIAGAWGIPPHLVGDLERATFSNIEHMSLDFVTNALNPYLVCIQQAVDRDLLSRSEMEQRLYTEFDTSQLLVGDSKSKAEAMQIKRQNGIINANEWRAEDGMDARADGGGDDYITPLNMRVEDGDGNVLEGDDDSGTASLALIRVIK